ncbi:MAG: TIGR03087 family PEP-CTERM/XrtA system glycosyltransferase [Fimbriiglobus sp.]
MMPTLTESQTSMPHDTPAPGRPRVLYITHRVPFPPDKGDRIRNFHMLRQLAARAEVWLIALADEPVPEETTIALNKLCQKVTIVPVAGFLRKVRAGFSALRGRSLTEGAFHEPGVEGVIRSYLSQAKFTSALVSCSGLAPYLRRNGLERLPGFMDLVDVDSQKWYDFAEAVRGPKRWLYNFEGGRLRKLERGLPKWVQATSIVSAHEAKVFESFAGDGTATIATNGVDLEYYSPIPLDAPTIPACAFVGALDYLPNVDAAIYFAREVWPRIRQTVPEAEFHVIGRKPTPEVLALGQLPGVVIVGQVPDVRPHVAKAAVAITPMRLSRGLQNKVLEAMAMAKPVVAAPPALAALKAVPGRDLLSASTPEEWHTAIVDLLGNPERRRELSQNARRFVEDHHHWDRCLRPMLDRVVAPAEVTKS